MPKLELFASTPFTIPESLPLAPGPPSIAASIVKLIQRGCFLKQNGNEGPKRQRGPTLPNWPFSLPRHERGVARETNDAQVGHTVLSIQRAYRDDDYY